ncbi:MAG: substrate-binding domain-containing protein [Alphaproteobacteria bacterium]|nr:substrate-binding domain-containing protein [Alphaproteobacteria bacterium]
MAKIIDRLGIAQDMKDKTIAQKNVGDVPVAVAKEDAEFGFAPSTVIVAAQGVQIAGSLPPELQTYITYIAAVGATPASLEAAQALVKYLREPEAIALIKSKGFELGRP